MNRLKHNRVLRADQIRLFVDKNSRKIEYKAQREFRKHLKKIPNSGNFLKKSLRRIFLQFKRSRKNSLGKNTLQ